MSHQGPLAHMEKYQCTNTNTSDVVRVAATVLLFDTSGIGDIEAAQNVEPNQPKMLNNALIRLIAVVRKSLLVSVRLKA